MQFNNITFFPQFKLHLTTNYKPSVYDNSFGLWRRINLIQWSVIVKAEDQDKQLLDKLKSELSGILNWALAGLQDYLKNGLQTPKSVLNDTAEYRHETDSIGLFLEECTVTGDIQFRAKARELYSCYGEWAKSTGRQPLNNTRFGNALRDKGFNSKKSCGITIYNNIAINTNI